MHPSAIIYVENPPAWCDSEFTIDTSVDEITPRLDLDLFESRVRLEENNLAMESKVSR